MPNKETYRKPVPEITGNEAAVIAGVHGFYKRAKIYYNIEAMTAIETDITLNGWRDRVIGFLIECDIHGSTVDGLELKALCQLADNVWVTLTGFNRKGKKNGLENNKRKRN